MKSPFSHLLLRSELYSHLYYSNDNNFSIVIMPGIQMHIESLYRSAFTLSLWICIVQGENVSVIMQGPWATAVEESTLSNQNTY